MELSYSDSEAFAIDPAAPLVIVDVDEVLAQFMRGFGAFVGRHGFELRVDRFALFQNIYRPGETDHLDLIAGKVLFDDFFRDGADDLAPAEGAADALADLSTRAGVVILTNAPEHGRVARARWLKTHGFDYPLIINSGPKGPPAAGLAGRTTGPSVFIDDLLPQLESVAASAPGVGRFQMVTDERLRPLAPTAPDRHTRIDHWPTLKTAIEARLFA
ncbi:hypothetical protein [Caulobacter sp.]|uniref:hypothetical protein n=1 Tax=Caulobacter sp. TaxID=78 RepID=UPI003BA8FC29